MKQCRGDRINRNSIRCPTFPLTTRLERHTCYRVYVFGFSRCPYLAPGGVVPQVHEPVRPTPVLVRVDELSREDAAEVDVVRAAAPQEAGFRLTGAHVRVAAAYVERAARARLRDGVHNSGRRHGVDVGLLSRLYNNARGSENMAGSPPPAPSCL